MSGKRVTEIDLLRFGAALAVLMYHYTFRGYAADHYSDVAYKNLAIFTKYGYLGVELFFIISGFVILMTATKSDLRAFIISRLTRLYPAFWACCTLTFVFVLLVHNPNFAASIKQYVINMTMLAEFFGVRSIDGSYWSLYIEMQFYVFVAVILLMGKINKFRVFMVFWLFITLLLEIFPINLLRRLFIADYSCYFIAGSFFYLIWSEGIEWKKLAVIFVCWIISIKESLSGINGFQAHFHTNENPYVVATAITGFYALMFLIATGNTGWFKNRNWTAIGALTYPLYLIHQYIGYEILYLFGHTLQKDLLLIVTITGVLALSYSVNTYIEKPFAAKMKAWLNSAWVNVSNSRNAKPLN